MKIKHLLHFGAFGLSTMLFKRKDPILGTIILTDQCNLKCKHCSVNNLTARIHPYEQIHSEMRQLHHMGIRILFFCGGETFLWESEGKTIRDLVVEAKAMGFYIVNVVTNGTYPLDLPEADLILLSLDGDAERHNFIRGETYETIMKNIELATAPNICLYMAINQLNKERVKHVCEVARQKPQVKAVSFNFHTPYPETQALALSKEEKRVICDEISTLIDEGYPIFNLKTAFPYLIENTFPTPCHQCVVIENGKVSVCGRCVDIPDLCDTCGYFFAAEYTLVFSGNLNVSFDMLKTYLKYI